MFDPRQLLEFGLAGLYAIAFLDSSFVSLPEINDILVMTLSIREPERGWQFALTAAAGSASGCSVLHAVGKKGGRPLLKRWFGDERVSRVEERFRRFDLLAVLVPALLPPPCPFKIFILASGVFGMTFPRFVSTVFAGRSVRYLSESWLAVRFGRQALEVIQENALELALAAALAIAGVGTWRYLRARRAAAAAAARAGGGL